MMPGHATPRPPTQTRRVCVLDCKVHSAQPRPRAPFEPLTFFTVFALFTGVVGKSSRRGPQTTTHKASSFAHEQRSQSHRRSGPSLVVERADC